MANRNDSNRTIGSRLDIAHILIGCAVFVLALFAVIKPQKYRFLFPLVFLLASVMHGLSAWYILSTTTQRQARKRKSGIAYAVLASVLFLLFAVSAISIWGHA